ncbi:MAG: LCP family protein [Clostridia bacterium]|nr:LCP family protein [Clostridia bacterium]
MLRRFLCLLLALALLPTAALGEDAALTDEEITQLLWEMYQSENGDADYLVLPEEYELPPEGKSGIYNLLLLGIDSPTDKITGRSDTMLLASFNARTGQLRLVSFLRDTYVSIPRHGHNKLNAAYSFGGADLLIETLGSSFGVHVDGYVAVNYSLMAALVDAIGGVELDVSADEMKKLNGILEYYNYLRGAPRDEGILKEAGTGTLNGLQTMSYARIRKLDSDFVRVQRQQKVILAIYQKLCSLDMLTLTGVITEYIGKVNTNVTLARAASLLASVLAHGGNMDIETLRVPIEHAYTRRTMNDTYYVVPNLEKCQTAIREFLYGQED